MIPRKIQILGKIIGSGNAAAILQKQYGIPISVIQAANHGGVWNVTGLLPYII
jgi:hypothetical protein